MSEINYKSLIEKDPWIVQKEQKCIISPDVDGILCGLFMSHYFNWEICGYYDGKDLAVKKNVKASECIFLDMEIFRSKVRSIGQHMVSYSNNNLPANWNNFSNSINPNEIREYDASRNFTLKYPLATIHLLMCIAKTNMEFTVPKSAIIALLYADGTFKNLLNYPENCISWLKFLKAKDANSPIAALLSIFASQKISTMMHDLEEIFDDFRKIASGKRGGDKIKISMIENNSFTTESKSRVEELITFLSNKTEWKFDKSKWAFDKLNVHSFSKGIISKKSKDGNDNIKRDLNNALFQDIISKNPLSFAITGTKQLEFTIDKNNLF
jgi:hypothetical protein